MRWLAREHRRRGGYRSAHEVSATARLPSRVIGRRSDVIPSRVRHVAATNGVHSPANGRRDRRRCPRSDFRSGRGAPRPSATRAVPELRGPGRQRGGVRARKRPARGRVRGALPSLLGRRGAPHGRGLPGLITWPATTSSSSEAARPARRWRSPPPRRAERDGARPHRPGPHRPRRLGRVPARRRLQRSDPGGGIQGRRPRRAEPPLVPSAP